MEAILKYINQSEYILSKNDILSKSYIFLEKNIEGNLLCIEIDSESIKIQFNLIEQYYFENIEDIFFDFFEGTYVVKYYLRNSSILYSKLVWGNKKLKKYNQRTKYGFHLCKRINKIEIVKGIKW